MVVKSTAFSLPSKCQSYNTLYRINILIGLTLINMFIKTKQISYSLEQWHERKQFKGDSDLHVLQLVS